MVDECGYLSDLCVTPHYCGDNADCDVRGREAVCVCKRDHQRIDEYPCIVEQGNVTASENLTVILLS